MLALTRVLGWDATNNFMTQESALDHCIFVQSSKQCASVEYMSCKAGFILAFECLIWAHIPLLISACKAKDKNKIFFCVQFSAKHPEKDA